MKTLIHYLARKRTKDAVFFKEVFTPQELECFAVAFDIAEGTCDYDAYDYLEPLETRKLYAAMGRSVKEAAKE